MSAWKTWQRSFLFGVHYMGGEANITGAFKTPEKFPLDPEEEEEYMDGIITAQAQTNLLIKYMGVIEGSMGFTTPKSASNPKEYMEKLDHVRDSTEFYTQAARPSEAYILIRNGMKKDMHSRIAEILDKMPPPQRKLSRKKILLDIEKILEKEYEKSV